MAAAASGGLIVSFLLTRQSEIFGPLRASLQRRQAVLAAKCGRIRELQQLVGRGLAGLDECAVVTLTRDLWLVLASAQRLRTVPLPNMSSHSGDVEYDATSHADSEEPLDDSPLSLDDLLFHRRWQQCGFPGDGQPLSAFVSSGGGLLAARSLLGFIKNYGEAAAAMVVEFAQERGRYGSSLPVIASQLSRCVSELLHIMPTPSTPDDAPMQVVLIAQLFHKSICIFSAPNPMEYLLNEHLSRSHPPHESLLSTSSTWLSNLCG